jgi:hypothetical protein
MYQSEFKVAIERTKNFKLPVDEVNYSSSRLLTDRLQEKFPFLLRDAVGEIGVEELVGECLSIHYRLLPAIEEIVGAKCYFTIGYVETTERNMFYQSESDLKQLMETGVSNPSLNIHAWITLPTMEIFDVSLPTSFAVLHKVKDGLGAIIASHADELTGGIKYHPMIVGTDYLRKIGVLIGY